MNHKIIFVFLIESHARDFQPKKEKMRNKTDENPAKRTVMDQLRSETRKQDRNRSILGENKETGP